ncbi:MAG: DUF2247 family protein [Firmicutes bacterium]|nr:DUF2247 family protein [Bacillota bacterium]
MGLQMQNDNIINKLIAAGEKITNGTISTMVSESKCYTNSLNIQISFSYASKLVNLNWNDILFSIENNYFHHSAGMDYAATLINENTRENDPIFKLACLFPSEIIKQEVLDQFIVKFAEQVSEKDKFESKEKIMYIVMNWLFENKDYFENIYTVLEYIYDNFSYPYHVDSLATSISFASPYPSGEEPDLNTTFNSYEDKIIYTWQKYLQEQKLKFGKT